MRIKSNIERISLETLNESASDLAKNYIYSLDSYVMAVAAVLMIAVNLFWLIMSLFNISSHMSLISHVGVAIGLLFPIITLIYLQMREETDYKHMRLMVILFQLCIILSTLFLDFSSARNASSMGSLSLALFWLFICALIPMVSHIDSAIVMTVMFSSTFLPQLLAYGPKAVNMSSILVAICIVVAYYGFRMFAIVNSRLIQNLAFTSYIDHQTGTMNKRALHEYLESLCKKNINNYGIIIYDIDDLRAFNYKYTHAEGDKMLLKVNNSVLNGLKSEGALVFRHGGGEFVAIIENVSSERILKIALNVKDTVEKLNIERDDGALRPYITVTIGCAIMDKGVSPSKDILSEADTQLYIGKKGSKNCVVFNGKIYVAEGEISTEQQPTLYTERVAQAVNEAMKRNEMKVFFQPLYDATTQNMVGAEALSRWEKPNGDIIMPSEYIPELEKNSSILALDWYMFEETCRVIKRIIDLGLTPTRVSVNFSRMHALYERDIEKRLCEIADSYSINHALIEIEITESAYIHFPNIIEPIIKAIRASGFAVAVDDFGSGASSLEFINSVDVDTLKIDKSLISSNCSDEKERVLLESVVMLAHRLQLNSVAEGVETIEQLGFLKTIGCKQIQGFIFSKPLNEDDFIEICSKEAQSHSTFTTQLPDGVISQTSLQMLVDTVFKEYPIVVISNISRNSYYTMTYENFTHHQYPKTGVLSSLLDEICSTIVPENRDEFKRIFAFKRQFELFKNGEAKFSYTVKLIDESTEVGYKDVDSLTYFIKEVGNDDLLAVTLCTES